MRLLESVPHPDALYDYRGSPGRDEEAPPLWLPHHQGDVFSGVDVPGIPSGDHLVMLFLHPCTMRSGASLKPQLTVLSVEQVSGRKVRDAEYWERRYAEMPLPDLLNEQRDTHSARFMSIGTVKSDDLKRSHRIAALSVLGRTILQQRIIHHLTRYSPRPAELLDATSAVQAEIELQADWVEARCLLAGNEDDATIEAAELEFDTFMSDEQRRQRLSDPSQAPRIAIDTQRAIRDF